MAGADTPPALAPHGPSADRQGQRHAISGTTPRRVYRHHWVTVWQRGAGGGRQSPGRGAVGVAHSSSRLPADTLVLRVPFWRCPWWSFSEERGGPCLSGGFARVPSNDPLFSAPNDLPGGADGGVPVCGQRPEAAAPAPERAGGAARAGHAAAVAAGRALRQHSQVSRPPPPAHGSARLQSARRGPRALGHSSPPSLGRGHRASPFPLRSSPLALSAPSGSCRVTWSRDWGAAQLRVTEGQVRTHSPGKRRGLSRCGRLSRRLPRTPAPSHVGGVLFSFIVEFCLIVNSVVFHINYL